MPQPVPTFDDWWAQTAALLPRGIAWLRDPTSVIGRVIAVIAKERKTRHDRKLILLEAESFPAFSLELLADWERLGGLPDPCRAAPGTLAERRAELIDVFFADHVPTPDNMVAWAAQAGWNITIREQREFVADVSAAGDAIGESDFVWVVSVLGQAISYFRVDENVAGDPLFTFPDIATLECVLRRAAPRHTALYFIVP